MAQGPRQREQALADPSVVRFSLRPARLSQLSPGPICTCALFSVTCYTSPDLWLIGGWFFIPAWALLLPEPGLEAQAELLILF